MKSKNVLLIFKRDIMYKPIIYRLARDFDVVFNVLEAKILPKLEGRLILELRGTEESINVSIDYLTREGVQVETLADKIVRNDTRCVHCGACTSVCSVDALRVNRTTMEVDFDHEICVACGLCIIACPVDAISGVSMDLD